MLIIGDDISDDDFGCYGHPNIRTPNVNKLANNGIRFTNAYLTTSQCSPSRCSVISGRYPHNTGAPELHLPLPKDQPMFPLELKKAGYHTAAAGKWHLGAHARSAFDTVVNSLPGGEERWIECLRERPKDRPFFMWFASYDAHRGWDGKGEKKKHLPADAVIPPYMVDAPATRSDLARYYDEVQRLDRYVGLVLEELKKQEVLNDTVIIFMADNGRPFPRCKTWLYDSGIKTPFVIHWPRGINKAGSVCRSLVSAIDIAPTILELAAVPIPSNIQGVSMIPVIENPSASIRQYVFAEHNWHDIEAHERMVRWKNWVYIRNARPGGAGLVSAHLSQPSYQDLLNLKKQNKLTAAQAEIFVNPRPAEALFNVDTDPHQLENLAGKSESADILAQLSKTLNEWQKRTGDTVPNILTSDIIDRKTGKWLGKYDKPKRGTVPGSERNASGITDPGPQ
ncbi:sulfatase family protein [Haloferula sp.]|uniref:sulfatase family protein n=1 Tax=Haloferula sp. TaxID=2497595 RepID=UPI003C75DBDD